MRILPMTLITLLMSCTSYETQVERCVISIEFDKCRCHQYQINKDNIGIVGESTDHELEYCDKLVGFRPKEWGTLRTFIGDVMLYLKQHTPQPVTIEE